MIDIKNLLYNKPTRHLNPTPKFVIKGKGKMINGYADILKNDFHRLNCSDKYLVKKIEVYPKLKSEDHRRVYGQAFPMENKIRVSMMDSRNRVLNKVEREKTLMHEIGHLKYYRLPDKEKDRIADEEEFSYGNEKSQSFLSGYENSLFKNKKHKRPKYVVVDRTSGEVAFGPTSIFRARDFFDYAADNTNEFRLPKFMIKRTDEYG